MGMSPCSNAALSRDDPGALRPLVTAKEQAVEEAITVESITDVIWMKAPVREQGIQTGWTQNHPYLIGEEAW